MEVSDSFDVLLRKFERQFLCCYPLTLMRWQDLPRNMSEQQQFDLLSRTSNHPLMKTAPIRLSYRRGFLKQLMELLGDSRTGEMDVCYSELMIFPPNLEGRIPGIYKHYLLSDRETPFSVSESNFFVESGTTGLVTWQASLALIDYFLHNPGLIRDKAVLELGAGTGLTGIILTRCCGTRQFLLTDGHYQCMKLMYSNVARNFPDKVKISHDTFKIQDQILGVCVLGWRFVQNISLEERIQPDVLLAADVVYDEDMFDDLVKAIDFVFQMKQNQIVMYLAATVRNPETLDKFLTLMHAQKLNFEEKSVVAEEHSKLYWDRSTAVKIFKITRKP